MLWSLRNLKPTKQQNRLISAKQFNVNTHKQLDVNKDQNKAMNQFQNHNDQIEPRSRRQSAHFQQHNNQHKHTDRRQLNKSDNNGTKLGQFGGANKQKQRSYSRERQRQQQRILQPNSKIPRPINQTKITKTHCNLQEISIPSHSNQSKKKQSKSKSRKSSQYSTHSNISTIDSNMNRNLSISYRPELIQQLYLSHNRISSVKYTLRLFTALRNLNLSYNLLSDVQQFIDQITGNYQDRQIEGEIKQNSLHIGSFQTFGARQQSTNRNMNSNGNAFTENNKLSCKNVIQLKMLYIRMNKFLYGYQDQIVKNIVSLQRLEDYIFVSKTNKFEQLNFDVSYSYTDTDKDSRNIAKSRINNKDCIDRQLIINICKRISQFFIPSYIKLTKTTKYLSQLYESIISAHLGEYKLNKARQTVSQYEPVISKIAKYIKANNNTSKQVRNIGAHKMNVLNRILTYELLAMQLGNLPQQANLEQVSSSQLTMRTFREIVREILVRFSKRNNYELIRSLEKSRLRLSNRSDKIDKQITDMAFTGIQIQKLINTFGLLYKARRHTIYQPNPGKYIDKIEPDKIRQHSLMQYINYDSIKNKNTRDAKEKHVRESGINNRNSVYLLDKAENQQKNADVTTLNGDRRKCKNSVYRQFRKYIPKQERIEDQHQDSLQIQIQPLPTDDQQAIHFQNVPIIIYDNNYLQIVEEIWEQHVRSFVKIYDMLHLGEDRSREDVSKTNRYVEIDERQSYANAGIQNSKYLGNRKQYDHNTKETNQNTHGNEVIQTRNECGTKMNSRRLQSKNIRIIQQMKEDNQEKEELDFKMAGNYNHRLTGRLTSKSKSKLKQMGNRQPDIKQVDCIQDGGKVGQANQDSKINRIRIDSKITTKNQFTYDQPIKSKQIVRSAHRNINSNEDRNRNSNKTIIKQAKKNQDCTVSDFDYGLKTRLSNSKYLHNQLQKGISMSEQVNNGKQIVHNVLDRRKTVKDTYKNLSKGSKQQIRHKNIERSDQQKANIERYSIYEIKLAYKVLLALKANKVKRQKKRAKKVCPNSVN